MDKFGIFNLIEKLSPLKEALKPLTSQVENKAENSELSKEKVEKLSIKTENNYSHKAVCDFIKRHDEISKRIDKNLKK